MNTSKLLRTAMHERGVTQSRLAEACGLSSQSAVCNFLQRQHGMRIDTLLTLLNAMGYEIVVRDSMSKQLCWELDSK